MQVCFVTNLVENNPKSIVFEKKCEFIFAILFPLKDQHDPPF